MIRWQGSFMHSSIIDHVMSLIPRKDYSCLEKASWVMHHCPAPLCLWHNFEPLLTHVMIQWSWERINPLVLLLQHRLFFTQRRGFSLDWFIAYFSNLAKRIIAVALAHEQSHHCPVKYEFGGYNHIELVIGQISLLLLFST